MLTFATCGKCFKSFIPNKSTSKCFYLLCMKYRCASCAYLYGATRNSHACQCGRSDHWYKISEINTLTVNEKFWINNTKPEKDFSAAWSEYISDHEQLKTDMQFVKEGTKCTENLQKENSELKDEMKRLTTENKELRDEMETMRNEMRSIKSLFINFENPKDQPRDSALQLRMDQTQERNAEFEAKFDEFEEYNQMIKDIQMDQGRIEQNNKEMEERHTEVCSNLQLEIAELQNQIDNFVTETKSDLNDKKSQLILKMKADIHKLQEKQKLLIDQSRTLQQQNIKRSKTLQNELEFTKHKFSNTVQMKNRLLSYYQTEDDAALPTKDSDEGLEKKKEFGSNLSVSTAASSFERIQDQQL